MLFETACKKAMQKLEKDWGDVGICLIRDIGDKWLFNGANEEGKTIYGKPGITIEKSTGAIGLFLLPNDENFKLLEKAVDVEIPNEYRVNH